MPRQLSIVETAKQRSLRVPLDYYRRGDPLRRAKWWLSALAAVSAGLYGLWVAAGGGAGRRQLSPGHVASVHAAWNDDCNTCHQDFRPLASDAFDWQSLLTSASSMHSAADQACTTCHDEPAHHTSASSAETPGCAQCHSEHRGAAAEIRRAADAHCLACHANFTSHLNGASGFNPPIAKVSGFATSDTVPPPHPDFRSLERDPGDIKFNHWLHLQPGIAPADARQKLRAADAAEALQRYGDGAGLVQLDCAACHEPDGDGRLMKSIAYDRHCAACHPLSVALKGDETRSVPHGMSTARLTEAIDGLLFQASREQTPSAAATTNESGELPLIPGRALGKNLAQKIQEDILGRRTTVVAQVRAKCSQCHYESEEGIEPSELAELRPANVPANWLRHGRFDHSAHRNVDCRTCHRDAYAFEQRDKPRFFVAGGGQSPLDQVARDDQQVMIAGIESCLDCHAPRRGSSGGARHDCAECHDYHGRNEHLNARPAVKISAHTPLPPASDYHFTSQQAASASEPLVGPSSCAASGCHGGAGTKLPSWQTALTTWVAEDPHVNAYDVLWTVRGQEMTRRLEGQQQSLNERAHAVALERRCVGCHASQRENSHALGVHCESCHGAAGKWQHSHWRSGFSRDGSNGFKDTKQLHQRASVCMPCHVGPSAGSIAGQVVDHDLIAAGHPRLAFEFHSYFESLPAHWDRQADEWQRQGDQHFQLWRAGQIAQAVAQEKLPTSDSKLEFSQLDCSRCHHALADGAWRQTAITAPDGSQPTSIVSALFEKPSMSVAERLALAHRLVAGGATDRSWDRSVHAYLAVQAIFADLKLSSREMLTIKSHRESLGKYLGHDSFAEVVTAERLPTIYDSPALFEPRILSSKTTLLLEALESVGRTQLPQPP